MCALIYYWGILLLLQVILLISSCCKGMTLLYEHISECIILYIVPTAHLVLYGPFYFIYIYSLFRYLERSYLYIDFLLKCWGTILMLGAFFQDREHSVILFYLSKCKFIWLLVLSTVLLISLIQLSSTCYWTWFDFTHILQVF